MSSYSLSGNELTTFAADGPRQFILTSNGGAFELANDGHVSQISPAGTVLLDTTGDSIGVWGNNLLDLEDNSQLWMHGAAGWQLLDVGVAAFQADSNGNVAILEDNGTLRLYPVGGPLTLKPVASNVQSIAVTAGGTVYFLSDLGVLQQYLGGTIGPVETGVQSFQLDVGGNLYELLTGGALIENENTTSPLETGVASFQVSGSGVVADLQTGGALQQSGATVASEVSSFAVAADGTLYYLTTAGLMKQGSGTAVDAGVTSFTLASDGTLYELQGATLILRNGATRVQLDSGVKSIAAADNGALYDLESSGVLYRHTVDGWSSSLDSGVKAILTARGGALIDLESSDVLWQHTSAGWSKLDGAVAALSLANDGFTLDVTDGTGAHPLTGIVELQTNSNTTVLDELFSDGSLWQYSGGRWGRLDGGVQQMGLSNDGTLIDLETNGNLYSHSGTTWKRLDSGASSFTIAGNIVTATDMTGAKMFTV